MTITTSNPLSGKSFKRSITMKGCAAVGAIVGTFVFPIIGTTVGALLGAFVAYCFLGPTQPVARDKP